MKAHVKAVYDLLAEAESQAHGKPVSEIHFHEVGMMDALFDITAVCFLMDKLGPLKVIASPVHVGSGKVRCAHGIMPVPAPATANLLKGIPVYSTGLEGELCTPTGAALIRHFATGFGPMPVMTVSAVGYGLGHKEFPVANCVRLLLGETMEEAKHREDRMIVYSFNVDDMTPEDVGFAIETFLAGGAREAFSQPVVMKKGRPGWLITVVAPERDEERTLSMIFEHTSTIGVRKVAVERSWMERRIEMVETSIGPVHVKFSEGYGVTKCKPEF